VKAKPEADEYASYYGKYVTLINDDDIVAALTAQLDNTVACLRGLSEAQGQHAYEPGKWSVKELLGHIIDTERIFAYRALRIARGDGTPLPGFEQDDYIANANFNATPLADLTTEFELVRQSNLAMFKQFSDEAWLRRGTASDNPVSVRALAYIIAGHEVHHLNILRARYL
jgi:uncharacterized damage-inducible protein DinB